LNLPRYTFALASTRTLAYHQQRRQKQLIYHSWDIRKFEEILDLPDKEADILVIQNVQRILHPHKPLAEPQSVFRALIPKLA